jgi:hypothetical protein
MIKIGPNSSNKCHVLGYTDETVDLMNNRIITELQSYIRNHTPLVNGIEIHNNTKGASITVAVINKVMYITVTDPDEVFQPIKLKEAYGTDSQTKEEQKTEPAAGDRTGSDPESVQATPEG